MKAVIRWTQRALVACAFLMLGYCAFVLLGTWAFQRAGQRQLDRRPVGRIAPLASPKEPPPAAGSLIGRVEIVRLGLSVIVVEGSSPTALRRAAGHIPGTALPGEPRNIGISAHRDTFFRPLRNIRRNDLITLATPHGEYCYRVVSTWIVGPTDVEVLAAGETEILTLVTCYPFYFVGSAPERFIVRAERVGNPS